MSSSRLPSLIGCIVVFLWASQARAAQAPTPAAGWTLELLAQAPDVLHPGTVACSPDGRIFVAEDPMDIRTERADVAEGRIVCFHPDGSRTVFVDEVYAAFGLQYLDGRLYVLHNPFFSVWDDAGSHGTNRVDLVTNTNPNWHALGWNDHVPANFRLGLDGRFYVATGDKGLFGAVARDGQRFDFFGGGIFRMRPDGTELELFSTGLRNIMDVVLDAEDNAFTYDNTDEHEWMGRLTYMVDGGYYGYPHDFIPRRPYTLWCFGDFGAGAATAAVCALDDALPANQRGDLFLADFGKRNVLQVKVTPNEGDFAVLGPSGPVLGVAGIGDVKPLFTDPPEDFRPVGLTFTPDGQSLLIGDWQHRDSKDTNAHVGRLWKLRWTGSQQATPRPQWYIPAGTGKPFAASDEELIAGLHHPAKDVRLCAQRRLAERAEGKLDSPVVRRLQDLAASSKEDPYARIHALWALDAVIRKPQPGRITEGQTASAIAKLIADSDPMVAGQAIRWAGEAQAAAAVSRLVERLRDPNPTLRLRAATALGRIGNPTTVNSLLDSLAGEALWPRYAAFTALNRIGRAHSSVWPAIVSRLSDSNSRTADGAQFALRATYDLGLVQALVAFQSDRTQPVRARIVAVELLAAAARQRPEWNGDWWAYHPFRTPPPTPSVAWAGTSMIKNALKEALQDPDPPVRLAAIRGLAADPDASVGEALRERLNSETDVAARATLLEALGQRKDPASAPTLVAVLTSRDADPVLVKAALTAAGTVGGPEVAGALVDWMRENAATPDSKLQLAAIHSAAELRAAGAAPVIAKWAEASNPDVGHAAIAALGQIGGDVARSALLRLLNSSNVEARRLVLSALATLPGSAAVPELLAAWREPELRSDALLALTRTPDLRALDVYLEGLAAKNPEQRGASRKAIESVRKAAQSLIEARVPNLPKETVRELQEIFRDEPNARDGPIFALQAIASTPEEYFQHALSNSGDPARGGALFRDATGLNCIGCHRLDGAGTDVGPDLSNMGAQFGPRDLAESILWPSKVVREGYQPVLIELKDGEEVAGLIKGESAELLTLRDSAGRLRNIPKSEIVGRRQSELSLMPEGLHAGLTMQEFADLVAFASSCRQQPIPTNAR